MCGPGGAFSAPRITEYTTAVTCDPFVPPVLRLARTHRKASPMDFEILILGAWTGITWWAAWSTCSTLHRRRQHLYSRRLQDMERRARREAALAFDLQRLGR